MRLSFLKRKENADHDRMRERLSPYLDGQLSDRDREGMERHLEGCQECRVELDALRATRMLLRTLPQARPPRSFVLVAAPKRQGLPRSFYWLRTATAAAAACLLLLLAAPALWPAGGASAPQPTTGGALSTAQPGKAGPPAPQQNLSTAATEKAQEQEPNPAVVAAQPAAAGSAASPQYPAAAAPAAKPALPASATPSLGQAPAASRASDERAGEPDASSSPRTLQAPPTQVPTPLARDVAGSTAGLERQPWLQPAQMVAGGMAILLGLVTLLVWTRHRRS